jgi:hypothetical protein
MRYERGSAERHRGRVRFYNDSCPSPTATEGFVEWIKQVDLVSMMNCVELMLRPT